MKGRQEFLPGFEPAARCRCAFPALPHFWGKVRAHPAYNRWGGMRHRCNSPESVHWKDYGGRGIRVSPEFDCSRVFLAWADANGFASDLDLNRIDNDGPYSPSNCNFITRKGNGRNKRNSRLVLDDVTLAELVEKSGLSRSTLKHRFARGLDLEAAVSEPVRLTSGLARLARDHGLSFSALKGRLKLGWSLERALSEPHVMVPKGPNELSRAARARAAGISAQTYALRLKAGWSEERALSEPVRRWVRRAASFEP